MKRTLRWIAVLALLGSLPLIMGQGCGGDAYYNDDCIGADGYNWCLAGSWDGMTIHEPNVPLLDFTDGGTYGDW